MNLLEFAVARPWLAAVIVFIACVTLDSMVENISRAIAGRWPKKEKDSTR
jgi:hypothetical protein